MKSKIVTTSLRIEKNDWLQLRAMAAELGMSVNEYINRLIGTGMLREQVDFVKEKKRDPIWDLPNITKGEKYKSGELSEDDKIIYG